MGGNVSAGLLKGGGGRVVMEVDVPWGGVGWEAVTVFTALIQATALTQVWTDRKRPSHS